MIANSDEPICVKTFSTIVKFMESFTAEPKLDTTSLGACVFWSQNLAVASQGDTLNCYDNQSWVTNDTKFKSF
jgi:hypothetical protein